METTILLILCIAAFFAGFIDAIVGGGGLIQTPIGLIVLPQLPVSSVIGSLKIPSFTGTFFATIQYLKNVKIALKSVIIFMTIALISSFFGSWLLVRVSNEFMKPVIFVALILLLIYTIFKKDFGQIQKEIPPKNVFILSILVSVVVGFYDGFIGPGTGSILVLAFIAVLGYDFLLASANAKLINLSTNLGSIILFSIKGKIIWSIAIPMAICNAVGGWVGAKLALAKGNQWIRIFFILVVLGTLIRFGYDIF